MWNGTGNVRLNFFDACCGAGFRLTNLNTGITATNGGNAAVLGARGVDRKSSKTRPTWIRGKHRRVVWRIDGPGRRLVEDANGSADGKLRPLPDGIGGRDVHRRQLPGAPRRPTSPTLRICMRCSPAASRHSRVTRASRRPATTSCRSANRRRRAACGSSTSTRPIRGAPRRVSPSARPAVRAGVAVLSHEQQLHHRH